MNKILTRNIDKEMVAIASTNFEKNYLKLYGNEK